MKGDGKPAGGRRMLVHVKRDDSGRIVAVSTTPAGEGWEAHASDSPELEAFAGALTCAQNALQASDLGLARVLEDVIDLLVERSIIRFTDLPAAAQDKLLDRRSTRASLQRLNLLGDEEEDVI